MSINQGLFSSNLDEYETPPKFMSAIKNGLGLTFDLDSCCSSYKCPLTDRVATTNKAPEYITEKDNALIREWHGRVWMNPPYGDVLPTWLKYAYEQSRKDYNEFVVCLIPSRTDTEWFHNIALKGDVLLLKGRIPFLDQGLVVGSPPFPSMLVIFRKNSLNPTISTWNWKEYIT